MKLRFESPRLVVLAILLWACIFPPSVRAEAAPPPLEVYGDFPKTEDLALSPNGKLMAVVNTVGNDRLLVISEVDGDGAALMTAKVGDARLDGVEWADDDHVIVYAHNTTWFEGVEQPFERAEVVRASNHTVRNLLPLSDSYQSVIFGRYGFSQADGHSYGYYGVVPMDPAGDTSQRSGWFKQRYPNLCRVDLDSGDIMTVARGNIANPRWVIDTSGNVVAESEYRSENGTWALYRPGSLTGPLLSGHADFGFAAIGMGRSPGTVLVRASDKDEAISEVRLADGQVDHFLPTGEGEKLHFSPVTHLLQAAEVVGNDDPFLTFDPLLAGHLFSVRKAFAGKFLTLTSISADLSRIVVKVSGGDISGTWQLVDFVSKKAKPLADAYPDIPDGMVGEVKEIHYKAADSLVIPAVLTLPPGRAAHALPLVVLPHGGPEAVDRPDFGWWAQAFASRGYAVLQPNFRGSDGYGVQFRNAGFGEWGRKMQTDLSDGIGFLAGEGIVDPKRVCIAGGSYGGYAAIAGVTLQHGIYRCAASYGGVSDPEALLRRDRQRAGREYMDAMMRFWDSYLDNRDGSHSYDALSLVGHAAQADAPILLIHGKRDTVVPIAQSEDMQSALKSAGKPVEFVA
ncbi:MAG TPA: prolyl oligopeptidase family serine peptidase, partial [Candidatus Binataceae bacterium]|nr:prolyl oligopeptidase family serine peptidase [Candidatus Binataceae bacterium]